MCAAGHNFAKNGIPQLAQAVYIAAAEVVHQFVMLTTVWLSLPNTNFTKEM